MRRSTSTPIGVGATTGAPASGASSATGAAVQSPAVGSTGYGSITGDRQRRPYHYAPVHETEEEHDHLAIPSQQLNAGSRKSSRAASPVSGGPGSGGQQTTPSSGTRSSGRRTPVSVGGGSSYGQTRTPTPTMSPPPPPDPIMQNMQIRYRLFNRLDPGGQILRMPDHIVPAEFFSILPFSEFIDESGKQSSLVTIFSIWNTMMGTSLLVMPWAVHQAGLALGAITTLAFAGMALYTAYRVAASPGELGLLAPDSGPPDFSDVCRYFWGRRGELFAVAFSMLALFGGVIVYWVLMSNFLYYTGTVIYNAVQPNSTELPVMVNKTFTCDVYCADNPELFSAGGGEPDFFTKVWKLQGTVPFYLAVMAFPLLNFKSPTFFTKFNVLGTVSVIYLLLFVGSKIGECGIHVDLTPGSEHHVQLANWRFPALTGTLALSFFIHNCVLNILRNQKHPEHNARDLSIGYGLACFCYIFIGVGFYVAFPTYKSCIADNLLNNFGPGDVLSATARLFLLFQMFTVLPLLFYLIRAQLSYCALGKVYPGLLYVCLINLAVMTIAVLFAVFFPHVGKILRYVGSLAGLVYVFALPCAVYMKILKIQGKLTRTKAVVHITIIVLGILNLLAQFFI